ncbi:MAG: T9SS type A sorting domain-containing protein [Bacteroidales bacterium]|nr:T9SS type A sorting domain-containing protein [Bacteroidales bacterium]
MITNLQQQETIEVCNLLGQVCFKGKAQDVLAVPVSTSGLYFVRIGKNLVRKVAVFKN